MYRIKLVKTQRDKQRKEGVRVGRKKKRKKIRKTRRGE
jgi:hypothetical protein